MIYKIIFYTFRKFKLKFVHYTGTQLDYNLKAGYNNEGLVWDGGVITDLKIGVN